jgi:hypothetical protein
VWRLDQTECFSNGTLASQSSADQARRISAHVRLTCSAHLLSKVLAIATEFCDSGFNPKDWTTSTLHIRKPTVTNNSYVFVFFLFTICTRSRLRSLAHHGEVITPNSLLTPRLSRDRTRWDELVTQN